MNKPPALPTIETEVTLLEALAVAVYYTELSLEPERTADQRAHAAEDGRRWHALAESMLLLTWVN